MIGKTTIGRSFKGCCAYNMDKVEQGKGEIVFSQGVRDYDQRAMVADFVRQSQMNPELSRSVWHTAISFDPQDEARLKANPGLVQSVARDYLAGMGLDQTQHVVIRHRDTEHSHFHIIANRVGDDGQTVSDSNNYKRSQKLLREIEQRHQLTPMQEQGQRAKIDHLPEGDRQRIEMRDQVRQALSESKEAMTFREKLGTYGINVIMNRDKDGFARGITFERTIQDEGGKEKQVAFKGSKLHQSLSVIKIQEQLIKNSGMSQRLPPMSPDMKNAERHAIKEKEPENEENTQRRGYRM
jgi:hypothetical protein